MSRTKARLRTVQLLYNKQFDDRFDIEEENDSILKNISLFEDQLDENDSAYSLYLYQGVIENVSKIDQEISKYSKRSINKISLIELAILRLGVFSFFYDSSIDNDIEDKEDGIARAKVVINECIKLSNLLSLETNYKYINAVLDKITKANKKSIEK